MADFPWTFWLGSTALFEGFLVWYILRTKSKGAVENLDWSFKSEGELTRAENPELFARLITGWWKLCLLLPFITFGLLYFGDF